MMVLIVDIWHRKWQITGPQLTRRVAVAPQQGHSSHTLSLRRHSSHATSLWRHSWATIHTPRRCGATAGPHSHATLTEFEGDEDSPGNPLATSCCQSPSATFAVDNGLHDDPQLSVSRCRSWEDCMDQDQDTASTSSSRCEYPIPWLEALFLPEFPNRSLLGEQHFLMLEELGSGAFGQVYRAVTRHDSRGIYAVKRQEKSKILSRNAVLQVKREASLLKLLPPHTFIARLYATWQSRTRLFSVMQYPEGGIGDLFTLWRDYGNFDEATVRIIGAELICAIDFLHRNSVIYRDLKLENVALDADGHVLMIDFGLAKRLRDGERTTTICGTLQYMCPCVSQGQPYSHYVDWWSLAVVLHVLYTGRYPYPNAEASHHSQLRFVDYSTPVGCSKEFGDLLDKMLTVPLGRRLRCFEVLHAHSFFRELNFERVEARMYDPLKTLKTKRSHPVPEDLLSMADGGVEEDCHDFDEKYEFDDFASFNNAL